MGGCCCCPCGEEFEEYAYPSSTIYRHCICLRYFLHLFSGNGTMFHRLEGRSVTSSIQGANSLSSTELGTSPLDSSLTQTHVSISRPVPFDNDQRFSRVQRDGLVLRREKSVTNIQEETQLLRRNNGSSCVDTLGAGKKCKGVDSEDEYKISRSDSSEKSLSSKVSHGRAYILPSSEDEDVCPTCLDEYTPENPKIITRCSHHFHLGCIYMSGWKGVTIVHYVERKWSSVKAHRDYISLASSQQQQKKTHVISLWPLKNSVDKYVSQACLK